MITEADVVTRLGLKWDEVEHCASCHAEFDDAYEYAGVDIEVDGQSVDVCCVVAAMWEGRWPRDRVNR